MTKAYESPSLLTGACKSGGAATRRAAGDHKRTSIRRTFDKASRDAHDLGLNKDETGAHILATFEAGMNSAADPGTVAVTH